MEQKFKEIFLKDSTDMVKLRAMMAQKERGLSFKKVASFFIFNQELPRGTLVNQRG